MTAHINQNSSARAGVLKPPPGGELWPLELD